MADAITSNSAAGSASEVFAAINGSAASISKTKNAADDAQTRFLTLLTAQLKNQDPLNPMDNAQMTSQLAQISTVEGIEKLNKTLQTLLENSASTQTLQAAALVGHAVLVPGKSLQLDESGAIGGFELTGPADQVTVKIYDANGIQMQAMSLGAHDAGMHKFHWDGKTDSGAQAVPGSYTIGIEAIQSGKPVSATAIQLGTVSSVAKSGTGLSLDLGRLGQFVLADVREIL